MLAHSARLVEGIRPPSAVLGELINATFKHQPAVVGVDQASSKATSTFHAATYFYSRCYISPTILTGIDGPQIGLEQFVSKVSSARPDRNRNTLFYLLGDVGVGKTALINATISNFHSVLLKNYKTWFIRVDLEKADAGHRYTVEELILNIADKTLRVLKTVGSAIHQERPNVCAALNVLEKTVCGLRYPSSSADTSKPTMTQLTANLASLVRTIREECELTLMLIIDNLDVMLHTNDRALFYEATTVADASVLQNVCDLVRIFFHDVSDLGRIGACVLVSMRQDSYQVLSRFGKTSLPEFEGNQISAFTVSSPVWSDVLEARGKLMRWLAGRVEPEGARASITPLVNSIVDHLKNTKRGERFIADEIRELSNNSLRRMMHYFSDCAIILGNDYSAGEKLLKNPNVGIMTYVLNGNKMYSQLDCDFPNIYLVNMQPSLKRKIDHRHPHSYWLKWMIVSFLLHREETGEHTTVEDVMDMFSSSRYLSYQHNVVSECLGSLGEADGCQMARRLLTDRGGTVYTEIQLLPRCRSFLNDVADSLHYLELIVDDWALPIPRLKQSKGTNLVQDFRLDEFSANYSHFMKSGPEYWKRAKEMVASKAYKVLMFIDVLESALGAELEIYNELYARLKARDVMWPDIGRIRNNVIGSATAISRAHHNFDIDVQVIQAAASGHTQAIKDFVSSAFAQAHAKRQSAKARPSNV